VKTKSKDPKAVLARAIQSLNADEPSDLTMKESRERVRSLLFAAEDVTSDNGPIYGCEAVQSLLSLYRRGKLSTPRALLIRSHLSECADCRKVDFRRGRLRLATTPWQSDARLELGSPVRKRSTFAVLAAAALVACIAFLMLRSSYFAVPSGQRALVEAVSGMLYRVDGSTVERLVAGAALAEGQVVRSGPSPQSLLRLADGSMVELGERAEFSLAMKGRDINVHLHRGQIIVQAAKRKVGHLYVEAPDCRVAVTGTVFSVLTSLKGSRVSVIEGEVRVAPSTGQTSVLHRGDQVTTNQALRPVPIEREIAWSRNLEDHLALLHALSALKTDWATIPEPELRYQSKFTNLVPDDTSVYVAIPNYGATLQEGYLLFKARLNESAVLKKWWEGSDLVQGTENFDGLITRMYELSSFLGDEVIIAGSVEGDEPQMVAMAEVKSKGLAERIGPTLSLPDGKSVPITMVDAEGATQFDSSHSTNIGVILLVTPDVVAFSTSSSAIAKVATRLQSKEQGAFVASRLGERITDAYQNGTGLLVAADLEMLAAGNLDRHVGHVDEMGPTHLLFERKVIGGKTQNSGELGFDGPREGFASWLSEPAPMGSLNFLTSQSSAVVAFLMKRPAEVLDDLTRLVPREHAFWSQLAKTEADWKVRLREDIADTLGAEVAIALDGPLLPLPSWKVVIEVEEADRLERGLELLVRRANEEMGKKAMGGLVFEHEKVGTYTFHRIKTRDSAIPLEVNYAFVDGYLVATPSSALLSRAIDAHASGDTLARSRRFTDGLPEDGQASLSGLLFQDLIGELASTLDSAEVAVTPELRPALEKLGRESKPTLVGFYGWPDRIEMSGTGELFPLGPEALALPELLRHAFPSAFNLPDK
jgi:hypothetical protein